MSVVYRGTIQGGVVVLEAVSDLAEGTVVLVQPADASAPHAESMAQAELPTLMELFGELFGKAQSLPDDMAENHDHYLHGTRKRTAE